MALPTAADISSNTTTLSDTIAATTLPTTSAVSVAITETVAPVVGIMQLQAQQHQHQQQHHHHHQQAMLQQQQHIQRQQLLEQQQRQLQLHLHVQQGHQSTLLMKQQHDQQQQQHRQRNMLQQRIFQQQQGLPLSLSTSFESPSKIDSPPQKRSRLLTINHPGSVTTTPLTPLSADVTSSPLLGMTSFAAAGQAMFIDSQYYRQQQSTTTPTTVQSITPDQFTGSDFDWMTVASGAATAASEMNSNNGLATPGPAPHSRSATEPSTMASSMSMTMSMSMVPSSTTTTSSSIMSPSISPSATVVATSSSSSSSTGTAILTTTPTTTTGTSAPDSIGPSSSSIASSPSSVMHLSLSSISVSTSDKHSLDSTVASTAESSSSMSPTPTPAITAVKSEQSSPVLSTKTDATPVAAPIIPSSSQKSSRRGRTKGGPVDPSVNTTPIPTHTTQFASHVPQPIHPLPASLGGMTPSTTTTPLESTKNPFESTTPTPQQHQFQHSVVLPSQQQHFEKYPSQQQHYHHSLATPTSATVPTPPLPLPSSHHQYLQQQQQPAEFNGSSHGTGLGLGLGLNLGYYDFMTPMPMPPSSASASTPSSSSSPPTPASAHIVTSAATRQSPVTTSSPVPKTSLIGGNGVSNGVGLYSNGSVLQNNDSSSSASSPSMLDLTGMASGLVDTVVVASQNPTTNGSLKRNSSHLVSTNAGSNKLFTSRGSYSSSSQGNSSVQTSPDIDAAHSAPLPSSNRFDRRHHHPHDGLLQEVDMDFEHDDQTNTSTVNGDDEQDRDDEDDDEDDPENNSPAICPHCLKEFQSKGLLRSHIVSHSSDRPFVCRDCSDKSYKRNHDLLRHRREKHNVEGAVIPPRGSGRHSHSGVSGGAKRGSGITMGLGGGDLAMMGGLGFTGGAGGVRNRSHRRSCSSAILGSGLGTRSTTTSSPFQHQGMARGLPDGYPTAVTVISQNPHQQQQQSKMPSPHDLMFASPAAAGMMFLNTTLAANGSSSGPSGANGLDFPHLASLGGSAPPTPTFTLPSQKQQLHHQQQPFGHQFQTPMHQQQLYHMQGRRPPPPPLPQQLQQHHQIHPLQQHPLSMQHALLQQQSQQHQRAASQQHLNMNLGISLGLSLEMSDFGISSMAASTAMDQQRRASSASDRNSISSQGGISCSTSTPSLSSTYSTTPSSSVSFASQASSSSPSSEMMSSGIPMLASQ